MQFTFVLWNHETRVNWTWLGELGTVGGQLPAMGLGKVLEARYWSWPKV